ncbi:uncharacterized protein ARMOST_18475 [Armillaria ostoyae]|uniref:Uncharacterized protein n=1 Tax=Armillaria ostoyae TaxID=47428 RepID=A0A284S1X1_ARMOS|nr:uncharacterized protein ARMOST_18475 [Armillaria ostoyae]
MGKGNLYRQVADSKGVLSITFKIRGPFARTPPQSFRHSTFPALNAIHRIIAQIRFAVDIPASTLWFVSLTSEARRIRWKGFGIPGSLLPTYIGHCFDGSTIILSVKKNGQEVTVSNNFDQEEGSGRLNRVLLGNGRLQTMPLLSRLGGSNVQRSTYECLMPWILWTLVRCFAGGGNTLLCLQRCTRLIDQKSTAVAQEFGQELRSLSPLIIWENRLRPVFYRFPAARTKQRWKKIESGTPFLVYLPDLNPRASLRLGKRSPLLPFTVFSLSCDT